MLNQNITQLKKLKTKKEDLSKKIKALNEQEEYLEGLIINEIRQEGLTKVTAAGVTCSIKNQIYPVIENWDKLLSLIIRDHKWDLLARKINTKLWREWVEDGFIIEGTKTHEKQSLNFRRL